MPEKRLARTRLAYVGGILPYPKESLNAPNEGWRTVSLKEGDVCSVAPEFRHLFDGAAQVKIGRTVTAKFPIDHYWK